MKILIGGSGNIGKYLDRKFGLEKKIASDLISIRTTQFDNFKEKFKQLNKEDVFIDSMDPNDVNDSFEISIYKKSVAFRNFALQNSSNIHYIYFSTASIYKPSINMIDEDGELNLNKSAYLMMKLCNENLIENNSKGLFSILRLVNIWDKGGDKSFFGDILSAKKNGTFIKPRDNDEYVITHANISDISSIIKFIIENRICKIINVTTDNFNSRENIKALVNKNKITPITNNLGQRIISKIINWEEIIKERKELF